MKPAGYWQIRGLLAAISVLLIFLLSIVVVHCSDEYHEEVFFKPVVGEKVYSYFQFTTLWNKSFENEDFDHCRLFPRSLAEIIRNFDVQELHVSLSEGHWRHRYWGYPVVEAAPGAEIWVWFRKNTRNIDQRWKGLTSALSGLLCASFNFIDSVNSVKPKFSFRPSGVDDDEDIDEPNDATSRVRYATLPREIVCTENLTPWKKMLPCDGSLGLASLLNARFIHNTNYHSLGVHYRQMCANNECTETKIEFKQTVSLVYDLVLLGGRGDEWTTRKLFGTGLFSSCPLASTSNMYVDVSSGDIELTKEPDTIYTAKIGGHIFKYAVYDVRRHVSSGNGFNMMVKSRRKTVPQQSHPLHQSSLVHVNRYVREYGKESGGIITKVYNNHREALIVTYFENIPWFVPIYYHTLKIRAGDGREIVPLAKRYSPGRIRSRPYHLEVVFEIPARSVVDISVDFDYMFLKWQEYPPDANHGFYVGSAVISAALPYARNYHALPPSAALIKDVFNASRSGYSFVVQLRTESFILGLPTPDFSMPYNVICLSCTVVALAFGPLHNITTKRLRLAKQSSKGVLRTFIAAKLAKLLGRAGAENQAQTVAAPPIQSIVDR